MLNLEVVHTGPRRGQHTSSCCDRTLAQLAPTDWLSRDPAQVTCGKLTPSDELLLLGTDPDPTGPATERVLFGLAVRVQALCGPSVSLQNAYDEVRSVAGELIFNEDDRERPSARLMIEIVNRASELARR